MAIRLFTTLLLWLGLCASALAQFNGINGIFALNHMTFGIMSQGLSVATPGSGYAISDTVTLDCPGGVYFPSIRPVITITAVTGGSPTAWTLTNPGIATQIPSTGVAGGANGVCNLVQFSTSGTGSGLVLTGAFGFNAAALNGSNTTGGGGSGSPGGSPGDLQTNGGGGLFGSITPGTGVPSALALAINLVSGGLVTSPVAAANLASGAALANLGYTPAHSGSNSDITSLNGLTTPLSKAQGGTGTATPNLVAGTNITITGTWPNQTINSTATGAVSSVANSDSTLTISPTTGSVVASLNPAHANTWTAAQTFSNGATVSSAFTATGLVTNADLANPATTVLGSTCTLGSTCSPIVALANLSTQAANTIVGNGTGSTASPTALAIPSCSTGTSALTWTSGTGFGCNSISGGGAVSSVSNSDSTLTISPTTGAVVGSLNLAHANTWSAAQTLNGGATVATSFTATGLVTNADLTNPATTVLGSTCTLGSTCSPIVALTNLATQAANTVVANVTGSSAAPTAAPLTDCHGANQAENYTAGTGFGCATITGGAATSIGVGTTSITSGTSGRLEYNNSGVLGEQTVSAALAPTGTTYDLVRDFGASCNNSHDDTTNIQNWLNVTNGVNVFLTAPAGKCLFSTGLVIPKPGLSTVQGSGAFATQFIYTGANTYTDLLRVGQVGSVTSGLTLRDFAIFSRTQMTGGYAIHLYNVAASQLVNVWADWNTNSDAGAGDLCGGFWWDYFGQDKMFNPNAYSVQNCADALLLNGKQIINGGAAELQVFGCEFVGKLVSGVSTGFVNGIHYAGGAGALRTDNCNLESNLGGFLDDEAVEPVSNREATLSSTPFNSQNYDILLNDPTGGAAHLEMPNTWIGANPSGHGLVVNAYRTGSIDISGGFVSNVCGSGLYLQDNTTSVNLGTGTFIQKNGGTGSGAGAVCTAWQAANGGTPSLGSGHGYGIEGANGVLATVTCSASNGSNVLTFSTAPSVYPGAFVTDTTNPTYIPTGTLTTASTPVTIPTTIYLTANTTHAISGDTCVFTNSPVLWNVAYSEAAAVTASGSATLSFGSSFTATQSTTNLVVSAVASGYLCLGDTVTGAVVGETITALPAAYVNNNSGFCANGTGTYTVSGSGTVTSGSMTTALTTTPPLGASATDGVVPTALPLGDTVAGTPSSTSVTLALNAQNGGVSVGDRIVFVWPLLPTTNATTASGNATLHFPSGTVAQLQPGDSIADLTTPSAIPANTYILSASGSTVTMSANAAGAGVGSGDQIQFTINSFQNVSSLASARNNPSGATSASVGGSPISSVQGSTDVQSGTTYTLPPADCGKTAVFTSNSAVTVTIPASIVPASGAACVIAVLQAGTAKVSVNGSAVSAATLVSANSYTGTSGTQGSVVNLVLSTVGAATNAYLTGDGS